VRKRLIDHEHTTDHRGLDLERIASAELTSEDPAHPIEDALRGNGCGWRAATPGKQVIRLTFDDPASLQTIELCFEETGTARTQEFSLRWSPDRNGSLREIVRQQYTFSPPGTTCESERYSIDLQNLTVLELHLTPDVAGGPAVASLNRLRVM
jgi:hypothetical protein